VSGSRARAASWRHAGDVVLAVGPAFDGDVAWGWSGDVAPLTCTPLDVDQLPPPPDATLHRLVPATDALAAWPELTLR
jgi:hypothetical protein